MFTLLGFGFVGVLGAGLGAKLGLIDIAKDIKLPGTDKTIHVEFTKENPIRIDLE